MSASSSAAAKRLCNVEPAWFESFGRRSSVRYSPTLNSLAFAEASSLRGVRRQPIKVIKTIPAIVIATTTGAKSNNPNVTLSRYEAIMILGGVPIRVMVPPNNDPKDRGINNSEGERPDSRDIQKTTGINNASAPTLLIKPEQSATTLVSVST